MNRHLLVPLILLLSTSNAFAADVCIPVDGLSFTKTGTSTLLVSRDGKNVGLLEVLDERAVYYFVIPDKPFTVRFFTPTVCNSGANAKFEIDKSLVTVRTLTLFK